MCNEFNINFVTLFSRRVTRQMVVRSFVSNINFLLNRLTKTIMMTLTAVTMLAVEVVILISTVIVTFIVVIIVI